MTALPTSRSRFTQIFPEMACTSIGATSTGGLNVFLNHRAAFGAYIIKNHRHIPKSVSGATFYKITEFKDTSVFDIKP